MKNPSVNYKLYSQLSTWQLLCRPWFLRVVVGSIAALTLGAMGSAILPLASAFAQTGVGAGFFVMVVVALCNAFTSKLLLRQSYLSSSPDYETLAYQIGGPCWRFFTELCLFGLLYGSLIGGISQLGEVGAAALQMLWCPSPPTWMLEPGSSEVADDGTIESTIWAGRYLMILYVGVLCLPWIFVRRMQQLEWACYVSFPSVIALVILIIWRCIDLGFPALADGTFKLGGFSSLADFSSTVSTFGFAFYIQPFMMPLLAEQPPGRVGVLITSTSVQGVLYGSAFISYALIGFFGAALWGPAAIETGNVLQNNLFGDPSVAGQYNCPDLGQGLINLFVSVYLAFAIPPVEYAARYTLDGWLEVLRVHGGCGRFIPDWDSRAGYWRTRAVAAFLLITATGLVFVLPGNSALVLEVMGATGVLMVSYVLPVVNHFIMYFNGALCQRRARAAADLGIPSRPNLTRDQLEELHDVVEEHKGRQVANFRLDIPTDHEPRTYRESAGLTDEILRASLVGRMPSIESGKDVETLGKDILDTPSDQNAKGLPADPSTSPSGLRRMRSFDLAPITAADYHPSPLHYRLSEKLGVLSIFHNVLLPVVVLAFGVFTSVCTLAYIDWSDL